MAITAPTPTVVPAQPEQVYDYLWMPLLQVQAFDPNQPVRAIIELCKASKDEYGVYTLSKSPQDRVSFIVDDLFAKAAERAAAGKPGLAVVIQTLLDEVKQLAIDEGHLT